MLVIPFTGSSNLNLPQRGVSVKDPPYNATGNAVALNGLSTTAANSGWN